MKLQDVIIWILFIISLLIAFWYLFGSSPTLEEALLILILTVLIANVSNTKELKTKFEFLENSFIRLAKDFKEHSYSKKKLNIPNYRN